MDEIFQKLMDQAGVPAEVQEQTLGKLRALKREYPTETPARLFARARKEGAPIPPTRCPHDAVRGECVACDTKVGPRIYFTSASANVHARPTCEGLLAGRNGLAIESIRADAGPVDGREACDRCRSAPARRAPARPRATAAPKVPARPPMMLRQGPVPLDQSRPPTVGDQLDWSGYLGEITDITESGVRFEVDGIILTAPWGDRARVKRKVL